MSEEFDLAEFDEVQRDRWGRPLIIQPDGTVKPYMRTSTLAGKAGGGLGLSIWKGRHIALAVAKSPDIAAILAGMEYDTNKTYLDQFIENALERAKMSEPANWGTAVHLFTEPQNAGREYVPREIKADVRSYEDELKRTGIEVVDTEVFVVNDEIECAGTFDHLYRLPAGMLLPDGSRVPPGGIVVVGDKKTGKLHALQIAVQEGTYTNSVRYDKKTGERSPLHPDLDRRWGLSVWIPLGRADTDIELIDLTAGYAVAKNLMENNRYERAEASLLTPIPDWAGLGRCAECLDAASTVSAEQGEQVWPDCCPNAGCSTAPPPVLSSPLLNAITAEAAGLVNTVAKVFAEVTDTPAQADRIPPRHLPVMACKKISVHNGYQVIATEACRVRHPSYLIPPEAMCELCNTGRHQCPGCGHDVDHDMTACAKCGTPDTGNRCPDCIDPAQAKHDPGQCPPLDAPAVDRGSVPAAGDAKVTEKMGAALLAAHQSSNGAFPAGTGGRTTGALNKYGLAVKTSSGPRISDAGRAWVRANLSGAGGVSDDEPIEYRPGTVVTPAAEVANYPAGTSDEIPLDKVNEGGRRMSPPEVAAYGRPIEVTVPDTIAVPAQREPERTIADDMQAIEAAWNEPAADDWAGRIAHAKVPGDLSAVWKDASRVGQWTKALEDLGKARLAELRSVKA